LQGIRGELVVGDEHAVSMPLVPNMKKGRLRRPF
jgi:hypothetical protein